MCGLFGFTGCDSGKLNQARKALKRLSHRGPDQWGDYYDENIYIGHMRLSILDLSESGRQPMISEDGDILITVNGEIYNFERLRNELSRKFIFKSNSDSEIVLHGYKEWGIEGLMTRIDGMYSIVVYDKAKKIVFLARDRAGIKPIYYAVIGNNLYWASELKALEEFLGTENLTYDNTSIYDFYTYNYIPAPKTLYREIKKLSPASFLTFEIENSTQNVEKYWALKAEARKISSGAAVEELLSHLRESIAEQMVSDVPVGFFLSGGIDSSSVVALAAEEIDELRTYTIGFEDDPKSETGFAKIVSDFIGTIHCEEILSQKDANILFPYIKEWYDEPFADMSCFATYLVSKVAREYVTVALTGDGGDELFGGYKWYKAFSVWERYRMPFLSFLRPFVTPLKENTGSLGKVFRGIEVLLMTDELEVYTRLMGGQIKSEKKGLRKKWGIPEDYDDYWAYRQYYNQELSTYTRLQYLDFHTYLPDNILTKVDRVSMSVSLECRIPFLSKNLIEFSFSLPEDIRNPNGRLKGILKTAIKEKLPDSIINRAKRGFNVPVKFWKKDIRNGYASRHERIISEVFKLK